MQLHELQPKTKFKSRKRVGRGGKRGTYSGKGQKGQKSRAGHRIRPAERDFIQRLPKLRGFKFKSLKEKPVVLNLGFLTSKIKSGIINREALLAAGLISKSEKNVKIVGQKKGNEPIKAVEISGLKVSKKLKEEIEKSGGKVN
ncbi:50S ribosomal protein L15 [Candidatus Wolfebacteria bacterium]|uniref:Large ribosomal subunit protein uL15 n=1 Tax=Candidatus Wolfebacteria bacterium CG_4_10_14_0_2_um_filter_39_18 TaxID=1975061 RepID=A0A2M7THV6_9BACT|nr:50S ribosomal protein L15 [Candidatus Wolfebacteria bacterium]NCO44666.1 50S ribosomal protein L15 [Candidatus Wolfebacteria bacterium]PIZ45446.1 MAG: 50S ribosomal protein L15 [Candidatus Wolfebacteria bacterium CG_4_10_14_0_2_um_filter_39_18]